MEKILVIQTASTGDVILLTSLLEKLHHKFEGARLDVLVKKPNHTLFVAHPYVNNVWIWDKGKRKYMNLLTLCESIRKERYDVVFCVQRFFSAGLITLCSGARNRIGFDKNPLSLFFTRRVRHRIGRGIHETDRNISLMEGMWCDKAPKPRLYPSQRDFAAVSRYKQGVYYTISPSSLWPTKTLPVEKWVELADRAERDCMIYLLGGDKDMEVCERIRRESSCDNIMNLSGRLSLLASAALMRDAKMNFCNDSAPLHLASAVNAPVTAVFCSTTPDFGFWPLSDDSLVVEAEPKPSCKPCGLHGARKCPRSTYECGINVDVRKLIDRL